MAYNPGMDLLTRVLTYIEERELLHPGETVVVGVSGGPDSLCLLDLLHRLSLDWRWQLHIAHLNHGLRPEAAVEADLVRAEAEKRAWPFIRRPSMWAMPQHKQSIEEAARNCRYEFLARVAGSVLLVAVAHTADDQAETVLMHTLAEVGWPGCAGCCQDCDHAEDQPSPAAVSIIRPLLHLRAEVILRRAWPASGAGP
jgi:tRNA(Ile)-lysidine synthase